MHKYNVYAYIHVCQSPCDTMLLTSLKYVAKTSDNITYAIHNNMSLSSPFSPSLCPPPPPPLTLFKRAHVPTMTCCVHRSRRPGHQCRVFDPTPTRYNVDNNYCHGIVRH